MPYNGSGTYQAPANSWNPAVGGSTIDSADWNSTQSDYETALSQVICKDGQTTITANLPMSGFKHTGVNTNSGNTSRSEYASGATLQDGAPLDAGSTGGTSTAYTATLTPAITAYADKQCFRVKFNAACGANPTIDFNSVGAKKIYQMSSGSAVQLVANDVLANQVWQLRYDATLDTAAGGFILMNYVSQFSITALTETTTVDNYADFLPIYDDSATANRKVRPEYLLGLMAGHLFGLGTSNNGSDANNDIDIAAGRAVDNTTFALMVLSSALTKRLDASWAVGTNQGGLDTGSKASNTWYYVWLIQRPDTGVVDALFSTSATSPTMPANYTNKRRIGAILTDGSSNIIGYTQTGDEFRWNDIPALNYSASLAGLTDQLVTMTMPPGFRMRVWGNLSTSGGTIAYVRDPSQSGQNPSATATPLGTVNNTIGIWSAVSDTSGRVTLRQNNTATTYVSTIGWEDTRGRESGV